MKSLALLLGLGWLICLIGAAFLFKWYVSEFWSEMPHMFVIGYGFFLLFVAFALPAKIVILCDALRRKS